MPRDPQRSGQTSTPFEVTFDAHVLSVPRARRDFVSWMCAAELDGEAVEDLEVVFSELAANAVAASPQATDDVCVRATFDAGVVVIEVSNRTADPQRILDPERIDGTPDLEDPLRPNGRGLLIARAFVDSVEIATEGTDRLLVRCWRRVGPPPLSEPQRCHGT